MSARKTILGGLFVLTLVAGAWIWLDEGAAQLTGGLRWEPFREAIRPLPVPARRSDLVGSLANHALYFWRMLGSNSELLLFGGIALFGILMMGIAISSARSTHNDTKEAMLELLRQEKEKAENLARLKAEFLNQVSHELRTPLAVIIGYLECIIDGLYGELQTKHQEILQVVAKQSGHLKNMIDQILIYSRLEASKQPLHVEEFHVGKILGELRDTFDFLCRQKGIALNWEISKEVTTLQSDPGRIKEILSNLLQNAVKYTDRGSISVRVRRPAGADSIMLEVADTGIGIPQDCLSTIFEPFIQAHKTSSEDSRGGIGLGLSIVKKHLQQIKGAIAVESQPGKGSTFRIILPRRYEERRSRRKQFFELIKSRIHRPSDVRGRLPSLSTARPRPTEHSSRALS